MELEAYCREVYDALSKDFFQEKGIWPYPNQTVESMMDIYRLAQETQPCFIFEFGTNRGASTTALAASGPMVTFDLFLGHWHLLLPDLLGPIASRYDVSLMEQVAAFERDFMDMDAEQWISPEYPYCVFYDMHDHDQPLSERFLREWYPRLGPGSRVLVHDIRPAGEWPEKPEKSWSSAEGYEGFAECERFVRYLIDNDIPFHCFSDGIWFAR